METNKKVEKVAEIIRMTAPDFTVAKSYFLAFNIVEALRDFPEQDLREIP
jgi:hypothetical protein